MEFSYIIVEKFPDDGIIEVLYKREGLPDFSRNIQIPQGLDITDTQVLRQLIVDNVPITQWNYYSDLPDISSITTGEEIQEIYVPVEVELEITEIAWVREEVNNATLVINELEDKLMDSKDWRDYRAGLIDYPLLPNFPDDVTRPLRPPVPSRVNALSVLTTLTLSGNPRPDA